MANLIVNISPPKCGTTGLYFALVASREVIGSTLKEPRFFAGEGDGDAPNLPNAMTTVGNYSNGLGWHDGLFKGERGERYRIDFTTYYAIIPETPQLIAQHYPNTKFIFVLRDPVKRFISQYYQYTKMGIRMPSIEEVVLGGNPISDLIYRFSDYRSTHERFAEAFSEEAIQFLDFRDLTQDYEKVAQACNAFLGTDDIEYDPSDREKNSAGRPRLGLLQRALFSDTARRAFQGVSPALKTKLLRIRKKVILANVKAEEYPPLPLWLETVLHERLAAQTTFYHERFPNGGLDAGANCERAMPHPAGRQT
ncbi:sulfotransferase domain-containing protein [bacterium]|nr:sulfotransferase domain-containing protein [bacterium]